MRMRGIPFQKGPKATGNSKGRTSGVGQEPQEMELSCVSKDMTSGSSAMVGWVPGIPVLET